MGPTVRTSAAFGAVIALGGTTRIRLVPREPVHVRRMGIVVGTAGQRVEGLSAGTVSIFTGGGGPAPAAAFAPTAVGTVLDLPVDDRTGLTLSLFSPAASVMAVAFFGDSPHSEPCAGGERLVMGIAEFPASSLINTSAAGASQVAEPIQVDRIVLPQSGFADDVTLSELRLGTVSPIVTASFRAESGAALVIAPGVSAKFFAANAVNVSGMLGRVTPGVGVRIATHGTEGGGGGFSFGGTIFGAACA